MFRKVLVANRGAIAMRILRTLRRMGIGSVAVYSEADAGALHVRRADEAVGIGGAGRRRELPGRRSHPRGRAPRPGAEAIHPGYGFLAENAEFAGRCEAAGHRLHRADARADPAPSASSTRRARWRREAGCRCCRAPTC